MLSLAPPPAAEPEDEDDDESAPGLPSPPAGEPPSLGKLVLGMPPPTDGKPAELELLAPPGIGIPAEPPCCPDCPPLEPVCAPAEEPCEVWPPPLEDWPPDWPPDDCAPGMPPEDEVPLGSELPAEPLDVEVCPAEPGIELGMPALGELPEPLEEEEDEGDDEGEEGIPDEEPPAEGIPPDAPPDDMAQPAIVTNTAPAVATRATRFSCAMARVLDRFMAVTFESAAARGDSATAKPAHRACRSSVGLLS